MPTSASVVTQKSSGTELATLKNITAIFSNPTCKEKNKKIQEKHENQRQIVLGQKEVTAEDTLLRDLSHFLEASLSTTTRKDTPRAGKQAEM